MEHALTGSDMRTSPAEVCFTERQLREVALVCFANAQEFHEEACLLLQHNHVRSVALAILGVEEFAKTIVYTVAAVCPDKHALLSKALFQEGRRNPELFRHEVKHLVTDIIDGALITADAAIDGMEWEAGCSMDAWQRFYMRLFQVVAYGLENLIRSHNEAKAQAKALNEIKYGAAPSTLKNLAFYVEIDRQGTIVTPSQLKRNQAESEIHGLDYFLENFALLPELLQNDERWQPCVHSIHQQLMTDRFAQ